MRRVRGRTPDGAPRPAGQPAGSPALPRKALSPRLLWGSPWEGAGALARLRPRRGRAEKQHQIHTYGRTTAWEEGEGTRGGQRNSHASLAAGSSIRKRIPGAPGHLCPSDAEGIRMRHRLDRAGGGGSSADSARPVLPR